MQATEYTRRYNDLMTALDNDDIEAFIEQVENEAFVNDTDASISLHPKALEAYKRRTLFRLKARNLWLAVCIFFSVLRYHFLRFKHGGWLAIPIFFLELPEHVRSVFFRFFGKNHDIGPD